MIEKSWFACGNWQVTKLGRKMMKNPQNERKKMNDHFLACSAPVNIRVMVGTKRSLKVNCRLNLKMGFLTFYYSREAVGMRCYAMSCHGSSLHSPA